MIKFITGTKPNWMISITDGLCRFTDEINSLSDEFRLDKKVFIVWAWNNEEARDKIVIAAGSDDIYLQDSQSEEIFGKGKVIVSLGTRDFNHYWKDKIKFGGQENIGWRYPYLIELISLDQNFLDHMETTSLIVKEKIAMNRMVTTRGFFKNLVSIPIQKDTLVRGKKIWGNDADNTKLRVHKAELRFKNVRLLTLEQPSNEKKRKFRELTKYQTYDREEVHAMFAAHTPFTPQAGVWGLQGIAPIPSQKGDFVFFVTLGHTEGHHTFDEGVTESGVLTWQSQPQQDLKDVRIQQLIQHDELKNSIHLFLRTKKNRKYTYLGQLKYLAHDKDKEKPVYFKWQILNWKINKEQLEHIELVLGPDQEEDQPKPSGQGLILEDPPDFSKSANGLPSTSFRGRKNIDYAERDKANRGLGLAGEELVLHLEKRRLLEAGKRSLAEAISHIALDEGDGMGYDILSFNEDGTKKFIEVKTTRGPKNTAFYVTQKELFYSQLHTEHYYLYRIFDFVDVYNGKYYIKPGALDKSFNLLATQYRAK